jgi:hypothetical protein
MGRIKKKEESLYSKLRGYNITLLFDIQKNYTVDDLKDALKERGITNYYITKLNASNRYLIATKEDLFDEVGGSFSKYNSYRFLIEHYKAKDVKDLYKIIEDFHKNCNYILAKERKEKVKYSINYSDLIFSH